MAVSEHDHTHEHEHDHDHELEYEYLTLEVDDDGVATLTLDRQTALNALNHDVLIELATFFDVVATDPAIKALVITGAGRAFIAGADISELSEIDDPFAGREAALGGQEVMNLLAALPFPTIAAINGFALGGGLELALAADMRVAAPGARLGLPEVGLGLIPGYGGTQRLPRLIGKGFALELIFTGRHVDAEEALRMGLVNKVAEDAVAAAQELARLTTKNGPIALGLAKEAVVRGVDMSLHEGLEIEADLFGMVSTTNDMREGTSAFLEKRKPDFQGN